MSGQQTISEILRDVFLAEAIPAHVIPAIAGHYEAIAGRLMAARRHRPEKALIVGLCGAQGSGKSTMAVALREILRRMYGQAVATFSLDDLYLSGVERAALAERVHPLFRTRGVPGTHDVALGRATIAGLATAASGQSTAIPAFDKATDEPVSRSLWPVFQGRADIVIFEGWCVGAKPEDAAALDTPVNALERLSDPRGVWRGYANAQLGGPYQTLFEMIDMLVMLRAPSFERVFAWRRLQERKLAERIRSSPDAAASARAMTDAELERFIMHYERLTRHILAEMPGRADIVAEIDDSQALVTLRLR